MNNIKMLAAIVPILFTARAIAQPLYVPYEAWPPCAVMAAEGEQVPDGRVVTGVICRSIAFIPDSDSDGVSDDADQCPETPAGVKVDSLGCPLDSDNDGVSDYLDQCPDTPVGVDVDSRGCPLDSDNDGVPDYLDRCPDTPEGAEVNKEGCPIDSDGDGVPNYQDQCPDTSPGAKVNKMGCSEPLVLHGVHFEFDSAKLTPEAYEVLDKVAESLRYYPDLEITIAGHTDSIGTEAYNQILSQLRAESVMNYLVSHGADPSTLKAIGYSEEHPIAPNDTKEGRAKNRRVELMTPKNQ